MNKKVQRIIVIVVVAALLLTVMVPVLSVLAGAAVTKDDIQEIKDELAEIQAQKKEMEEKLAAVRDDMAKAKEQMELIQDQIITVEAQINTSQMLLDQYDLQIEGKEQQIEALEQQEQDQLEEFYRQVRWMEETGSVSYLSILFEASSFQELLDYAMLITDIMEYSNRIIDRLQDTQDEIAVARDELQASRDEQAVAQAELEAQKAELDDKRAEQNELLNKIAASESELAEQARLEAESEAEINKALKEAEDKYAAQLAEIERKRKEAEAAAAAAAAANKNNYNNNNAGSGNSTVPSTGPNVTGGSWYWPLPGRYRLSSLFGGRILWGYYDNHTGTDIPAPGGTPIYAANDGVVTTVNANPYASSYGNYCIISHGGGYATLYAHQCQAPAVSVGQTVSKGQVIGYVGTTGNSSGNHLHFELRINGVRASALKLYPGMTFTGPDGRAVYGG